MCVDRSVFAFVLMLSHKTFWEIVVVGWFMGGLFGRWLIHVW